MRTGHKLDGKPVYTVLLKYYSMRSLICFTVQLLEREQQIKATFIKHIIFLFHLYLFLYYLTYLFISWTIYLYFHSCYLFVIMARLFILYFPKFYNTGMKDFDKQTDVPYQSEMFAGILLLYCGNIAATHFCCQKPYFETSEMLPLAATTSGNILATQPEINFW